MSGESMPPQPHQSQPPTLSKSWRLAGICFAALLVILALWGIFSRIHAENALQKETDDQAIPTVNVIAAKASPTSEELVLPGNVQANFDTGVYARTSGYLKRWYTDIGTPVKAGQLLADIDTPEVDD